MTWNYADQGCASVWSCYERNVLQPIRSTTQIWTVTRHRYGISNLVPQSSFRGETTLVASGNVDCFLSTWAVKKFFLLSARYAFNFLKSRLKHVYFSIHWSYCPFFICRVRVRFTLRWGLCFNFPKWLWKVTISLLVSWFAVANVHLLQDTCCIVSQCG